MLIKWYKNTIIINITIMIIIIIIIIIMSHDVGLCVNVCDWVYANVCYNE